MIIPRPGREGRSYFPLCTLLIKHYKSESLADLLRGQLSRSQRNNSWTWPGTTIRRAVLMLLTCNYERPDQTRQEKEEKKGREEWEEIWKEKQLDFKSSHFPILVLLFRYLFSVSFFLLNWNIENRFDLLLRPINRLHIIRRVEGREDTALGLEHLNAVQLSCSTHTHISHTTYTHTFW